MHLLAAAACLLAALALLGADGILVKKIRRSSTQLLSRRERRQAPITAKTRYESESIKASGGLGDCRPYHHGAWRNCDRRGHCTPDHAPAARILAHPTSVFVSPQ